jgi:hypothetical protein
LTIKAFSPCTHRRHTFVVDAVRALAVARTAASLVERAGRAGCATAIHVRLSAILLAIIAALKLQQQAFKTQSVAHRSVSARGIAVSAALLAGSRRNECLQAEQHTYDATVCIPGVKQSAQPQQSILNTQQEQQLEQLHETAKHVRMAHTWSTQTPDLQ